jgi:glycoprotein-N-acetylgalactosamine 3-beta-galactosyltransferase
VNQIFKFVVNNERNHNFSYFESRTWANRCDHSVFIIAGSHPLRPFDRSTFPLSIAFIGDEKIEKYNQLSEKILISLLYIYERYGRDYDWFFKADDDTYVIVENLRHLLRRRASNASAYFGYIAKTPDRFYPSGGAGYVLSQEALLKFGEEILIKPEKRKLCKTDEAEDINLAYCLARIGIFPTNTRDDQQLETFHPMTFEEHFLGNFTKWIEKNAQFEQKKGEECCSPLTISFHSLSPVQMRMMHFLLYQIQKASS